MALTINSPVDDLLNDDKAKEVIDRLLPGLSSHPQIGMARTMGLSLKAVADFSGGKITDDMLAAVAKELG